MIKSRYLDNALAICLIDEVWILVAFKKNSSNDLIVANSPVSLNDTTGVLLPSITEP